MATTIRSNGLQHAISLGNIEVSAKTNSIHTPARCYDSEDENMGRRKTGPSAAASGLYPKTSVYSKGDIREQYCLTDRQLSSIERPRRERFFGCWSGRGAPQSFLGVCVGRRAPSDENIADYAPFYKYPRYHPHDLLQYDEDLESSYFRRRPTSILSSGAADAKRYTWIPADEEAVRLEGPRPICPEYEDFHRGPYVVGSYPPKQYLSQSTEQIAGLYRCPAHIGLPPPPPPPVVPMEPATPRTKHVSFARSHTLTSFDEASMGFRSSIRLKSARSQERLIGGKKPILTSGALPQPQQMPMAGPQQMQQMLQTSAFHQHHHHQQMMPAQHQHQHQHPAQLQQQQQQSTPHQQQQHQHPPPQVVQLQQQTMPPQPGAGLMGPQSHQPHQPHPEVVIVEKIKRSTMKTQATQTEVYLGRKGISPHHLSLSPRTIHRVRMVSQGAQTNGMLNGRKLTKSLSEMTAGQVCENHKSDEPKTPSEHEQLHRTYSEEPPRSPLMVPPPVHLQRYYEPAPQSRTSSCTSEQPPSSLDHLSGHSRNHSQDSATSFRSTDATCMTPSPSAVLSYFGPMSVQSAATTTATTSATKTSQDSRLNFSYESMLSGGGVPSISRPESRQALDGAHIGFDYESNSLPRRTCGHHRMEEYYSYSLPRREHYHQHEVCRHVTECAELLNGTVPMFRREAISRGSSTDSSQLFEKRRLSVGIEITPKTHASFRRQSMPAHASQIIPSGGGRISSSEEKDELTEGGDKIEDTKKQDSALVAEEEYDGRDEEEEDQEEEEQEIFIDFKPHVSPTPSPRSRRKKLQKTLSDGEILLEKRQDIRDGVLIASASEEELKPKEAHAAEYQYQNLPIKDEGICDKQNLLALPSSGDGDGTLRHKRETFRKRSISLEDPTADGEMGLTKSAPPSPCQDEVSHVQSAYPSSDSLANDLTRDHSDGIWNESQVTVLPAEVRDEETVPPLLTPSSRRKHLLLQHQQRSSIDTEVLDLEEQMSDQSVPRVASPMVKPASTQTTTLSPTVVESIVTSPTLILPTPAIAVTPSLSVDGDDQEVPFRLSTSSRGSSRTLSPGLQDRRKIEPLVHTHSPQRHPDITDVPKTPSIEQLPASRPEVIPKNNTDISECSTNTDEYVTCTDNSKRTPGMKTPTTASSSSTQVPVSAQSSQTATHDGSSFESASSLYSTRGDGLSEEMPQIEEMPSTSEPAPSTTTTTTTKPSPSHSVSSSSSGSYNLTDLARSKAAVKASPLRMIPVKPAVLSKKKSESISDDERSEKRYSSSGYYESPQDDDHRSAKHRRTRERFEEERRRRKNNMKLDIERENLRALTSPIKRPSPGFKQISPEDRSAMNVLDGASPSKTKRFRPKIRRQLRKSTAVREESIPRKTKAISAKSPEKAIERRTPPPMKISPSKYEKVQTSPKKQATDSGSEKKLKAKSIESLRSVSPGSDSVFYSEADIVPDQQVHCLHCGKEVEIITAISGSQDSTAAIEDDGPDIVKPPADFADSPVTTKTSQRLYKKMDKRFRSEERHGDRRHYRNRHENARAKSEERGKESTSQSPPALRPAGSSPCVMPEESEKISERGTDLDQVIYRGNYRQGLYTRLTDSDVWIQLDHQSFDRHRDRRGSTDSEKAFHQKYQVILHRLVQRRCTLEMYHRQKSNSFKLLSSESAPTSMKRKLEELYKLMLMIWARQGQAIKAVSPNKENEIDKTVVVKSDSGEFGFRIHGSKPVVVAAIEPDTPAESSGLEVGDIIISVNGIPVLDKHHTEVVKIAHAGCETLELEVARTIGVLMNEQQESASPALYTGYLWRQSGQAKGTPNSKKWVLRWFCLRPDHCLYYYKTDSDTQPVGAVILTNHTVEHCSSDVGKSYAFKIDSGEGIPMYLAAETEEAANRWLAVLSHASMQPDPWLEMTGRNLRMPPNAIARPDCFGHLMKLGSRWCGWSKRYCVLKDACLYFYQDTNSKNAFGMACLQGYKVVAMSSNAAGRKNAFEIVPPESKLRHYYFSTESEMDKKRWISALEYSIDRWIKAG